MDTAAVASAEPTVDSQQPIPPPPPPVDPVPATQPVAPAPPRPSVKMLKVSDALSYLDAVKAQFHDEPDVYNKFLDIMKQFKSQNIDTPGVIKRVSDLFRDHPNLIQGFNTFLPSGYRIECGKDDQDANLITVTTPSGTTISTTKNGLQQWSDSLGNPVAGPAPLPPVPKLSQREAQKARNAVDPAIQYVQKIKQRCDPKTYQQFLDILSDFHHAQEPVDEEEVSNKIKILFKDDPDLRADFAMFLPEGHRKSLEEQAVLRSERTKQKKQDPAASGSSVVPAKRKRKAPIERELVEVIPKVVPAKVKKPKPTPEPTVIKERPPSPPRRHSGARGQQLPSQPVLAAAPEDSHAQVFFDRVKRSLEDSRDTYTEFLKLINLFTQDYIDTARLVRESRNYIGEGDLFNMLKEIVGWDSRKEKEYMLEEEANGNPWTRPTLVPQNVGSRVEGPGTSLRHGSYRKIPAVEANVACSGRDEMCRSVLNDDWVSHPTWSSEDTGFMTPRMNIYEEALHRSEEERHEYDFHIEAIVRTITMLEPLSNKMASLSQEDRANYKPKANLNGQMKSIHQRVIKKIYGREAGLAVIQAMQDTPATAIPVVLMRLKQKEEEWKRAQREWHKVWREVDARNYSKSLDHQGILFKTADKKAITTKAFLTQIENAREQQIGKRASLIDPLLARTRPRHQLEFVLDDESVLLDGLKLTFSYLDRTQSTSFSERRRAENFLRSFIPLFFMLDPIAFNASFVTVNEAAEGALSDDGSGAEEAEVSSVGSGSSRAASKSRRTGGGSDLRKKLLKSEQAKSARRTRHTGSPSVSRLSSPVPMDEDGEPGSVRQPERTAFFAHTPFYSLLRMIELLCSRLSVFKNVTKQLCEQGTERAPSDPGNFPPDVVCSGGRGMEKPKPEHSYNVLLQSCEQLFDDVIDLPTFEDQMRFLFGNKEAYKIFTIDKLLAAIVKQVQTLLSDNRTQDLLDLLKRERILTNPTAQDLSSTRKTAEDILGPDENLFRIDWLPTSKHITFQLIGKEDYDSEVATGRWQSYIESFVSTHITEGVSPNRVRSPFLRRNLSAEVQKAPPNVVTADGLEIKICVQTYRLFYVSRSEDYLFKLRSREEAEQLRRRPQRRNASRLKWLN
ncbi:HDAC-interact domain-containing protein [Mycena kentingensis (nom. inval.)]|nr:HDAC-interact domain-containing protein [Mycena kentingensis (nom. inval.)]